MKANYKGYENYLFKTKQKKKFKLPLFLIIVSLLLVLIVGFNYNNILRIFNLKTQKICDSRTFYVLSYGAFDNYELAYQNTSAIKSLGGVGYPFLNDEKYCIAISIYPTLEDCEKVQANLLNQNVNSTIISLTSNEFVLKDSPKIDDYQNLLLCHYEIFNNVYEIFTNLDMEKQNTMAKQKLNELCVNYKVKIKKFLSTDIVSKEILNIKLHFNYVLNLLDNLTMLDEQNLALGIQYNLILLAQDYVYMLK